MLKLVILLPVLFAALLFVLAFGYMVFRRGYHVSKPNEALVVVKKSRGKKGQTLTDVNEVDAKKAIKEGRIDDRGGQVVTDGGIWVNPVTARVYRFSTAIQTTNFEVACYDQNKIPLKVKGVLLYKVGENVPAIIAAATRFLDFDPKDMDRAIGELVTGQIRAMVGASTIESLITNRQELTDKVREATGDDMAKLGLQIDSLSIQDLDDDNDYIKNLSAPQAAAVAQAASIAEDAARKAKAEAKNKADLEISDIERSTKVEQAKFKAEQDEAEQDAAQAGPLAKAKAEKQVVEEQTRVAELEAARTEKRLDSDVRAVAEADRFAAEQAAEAEAKAIEALGDAEAAAIKAKAEAEAAGIEARAKALAENGELLIEEQLASNMENIVAAAAKPLSEIDTMVVTDGAEGVSQALMSTVAVAGEAIGKVLRKDHPGGATQPSMESEVIEAAPEAPAATSSAAEAVKRYQSEGEGKPSEADAASETEIISEADPSEALKMISDLTEQARDISDFDNLLENALNEPETRDLVKAGIDHLAENPNKLGDLPGLRNVDTKTVIEVLGLLKKRI